MPVLQRPAARVPAVAGPLRRHGHPGHRVVGRRRSHHPGPDRQAWPAIPVGHSADARPIATTTGAFVNNDPMYLQSTGFVLDPRGRVVVSVYSSGAIGRLVPEDVTGLIRAAALLRGRLVEASAVTAQRREQDGDRYITGDRKRGSRRAMAGLTAAGCSAWVSGAGRRRCGPRRGPPPARPRCAGPCRSLRSS